MQGGRGPGGERWVKRRVWLALLALAAAIWLTIRTDSPTNREVVAPGVSQATPPRAVDASVLREQHPPAPANPFPVGSRKPSPSSGEVPAALTASATPAIPLVTSPAVGIETTLEEVQTMLRDYRSALGENPIGTNAEIIRAINGDNLKQVNIGAPPGQRLNDQGELIDTWGTPYFFHQVSRDRMEVRSAGPDRVMWTADDRQM